MSNEITSLDRANSLAWVGDRVRVWIEVREQ